MGAIDGETTCGFYMAPSTTSPNLLGLYTAKDIPLESSDDIDTDTSTWNDPTVTSRPNIGGPADMAIQFVDEDDEEGDSSIFMNSYLEELIWTPSFTGGSFEYPSDNVVTLVPGVGMLGAYHPTLTNAQWDAMSILKRSPNYSGDHHNAGAGAFTNYYNVSARVTRNVWSGEEIFLDFGNEWDEHQQDHQQKEQTDDDENKNRDPTTKDYKLADEKIKFIHQYFEKHAEEFKILSEDSSLSKKHNPNLKQDVYNYILSTIIDRMVRKLLPPDVTELDAVYKYGTNLYHQQDTQIKSLEWLETNGRCIDHLHAKTSTLSSFFDFDIDVGRGAFASRPLQKGQIVLTTPLAPILDPNELDFNVSQFANIDSTGESNESRKRKQLLFNYCFGHPQSSLLLFPYANMVNFINHASTRTLKHENGNERKPSPNVKLQWSQSYPMFDSSYLSKPLSEIKQIREPLLFMDVVALRDLNPGEEIFMDYGINWEHAWNQHVNEFPNTPPMNTTSAMEHTSHLHLNEIMKQNSNMSFPTLSEQQQDSQLKFPKNVMTVCFVSEHLVLISQAEQQRKLEEQQQERQMKTMQQQKESKKEKYSEEQLNKTSLSPSIDWNRVNESFDGDSLRPCEIMERRSAVIHESKEKVYDSKRNSYSPKNIASSFMYTVKVQTKASPSTQTPIVSNNDNDHNENHDEQNHIYIENVPHHAIMYMEKAGYSQVYTPKAFRHYIGLEDDLFPKAWMDKKNAETLEGELSSIPKK